MTRDNGSRRLVKFWSALVFTLGVAVGAIALNYLQAQRTLWLIGFLGAVAGAVAIFEQFGEARDPGVRGSYKHWQNRGRPTFSAAPRKEAKNKPPSRRGQLRAINGKKTADPPSSGAS
jgi:uncharacterized membrane protein YfcA